MSPSGNDVPEVCLTLCRSAASGASGYSEFARTLCAARRLQRQLDVSPLFTVFSVPLFVEVTQKRASAFGVFRTNPEFRGPQIDPASWCPAKYVLFRLVLDEIIDSFSI